MQRQIQAIVESCAYSSVSLVDWLAFELQAAMECLGRQCAVKVYCCTSDTECLARQRLQLHRVKRKKCLMHLKSMACLFPRSSTLQFFILFLLGGVGRGHHWRDEREAPKHERQQRPSARENEDGAEEDHPHLLGCCGGNESFRRGGRWCEEGMAGGGRR